MCRCSKSIPASCKGMQVFKYLYKTGKTGIIISSGPCVVTTSTVVSFGGRMSSYAQQLQHPLGFAPSSCHKTTVGGNFLWPKRFGEVMNIGSTLGRPWKRLKRNTIMTVTDKSTVGGDGGGARKSCLSGWTCNQCIGTKTKRLPKQIVQELARIAKNKKNAMFSFHLYS